MFDMIKHFPWIFHISSNMHTFNTIHTTPYKIYWHFEYKYFIFGLPQEFVVMDVLETQMVFERHDTIYCALSTMSKTLGARYKITIFEEARILNLIITTSKDEPTNWCPLLFDGDLRRQYVRNCLLTPITIARFLAIYVLMTSLTIHW